MDDCTVENIEEDLQKVNVLLIKVTRNIVSKALKNEEIFDDEKEHQKILQSQKKNLESILKSMGVLAGNKSNKNKEGKFIPNIGKHSSAVADMRVKSVSENE